MTGDSLEEKSLWYKYKTQVWFQDTPQAAVVHNTLRVLRSIRHISGLGYVSVPITSGKWLYEQMLAQPERPKSELIRAAIAHNYNQGWVFVEELKTKLQIPILYPADLIPTRQEWEQTHFQALWLSILGEKCTELHMSPDWEYSNGGVEEFTHTIQLRLGLPKHDKLVFFNTKESESKERERMKNIKIYDAAGSPLSIDDGIRLIETSSAWIKQNKFDAKRLDNCLELLHWTEEKINQKFYQ